MHCLRLLVTVWAIICALWGPSFVRCAVSSVRERVGEECKFPDGVSGRCEELSECLSTGGVAKRNGSVVLCRSSSAFVVHVCCRRPDLIAQAMCNVWSKYWSSTARTLTCTTEKPLIYGGVEAVLGEFPHMASVGRREDNDIKWDCGGSLITPLFVLTAAHCVSSKSIVVTLGEHDRFLPSEGTIERMNITSLPQGLAGKDSMRLGVVDLVPIEQVIDVAEVFVYPEFQSRYHDIALLKLKQPAAVTTRVLPACLSTSALQDFTRDSAFVVAGWGRTEENRSGSDQLMKVNINYTEASLCLDIFRNHSVASLPWGVTSDLICAGERGKDACTGDSGGPLMPEMEMDLPAMPQGRCRPRVVAGVVSAGPSCGIIGAYTRVASYLEWITAIVAPAAHPTPGEE